MKKRIYTQIVLAVAMLSGNAAFSACAFAQPCDIDSQLFMTKDYPNGLLIRCNLDDSHGTISGEISFTPDTTVLPTTPILASQYYVFELDQGGPFEIYQIVSQGGPQNVLTDPYLHYKINRLNVLLNSDMTVDDLYIFDTDGQEHDDDDFSTVSYRVPLPTSPAPIFAPPTNNSP